MKVSSFILGGIVGASAVWVVSKRNHPIMNMAKIMMKNAFSEKSKTHSRHSDSIKELSESSRMENESLVRSIIEQDPQLKQEFDEITKQTFVTNTEQSIAASEQLQ